MANSDDLEARLEGLKEKYYPDLMNHLNRVSRTFALTIPFLDMCASKKEYRKAFHTLLCYLDARVVDAIEDSLHSGADKREFYAGLNGFRVSGPVSSWKIRWKEFAKKVTAVDEGTGKCKIFNPYEAELIKNFEPALECFWAQDPEIQANTVLWLPEMAHVMGQFDAPRSIKTIGELDHYCFGVASTVGRWLSYLVELKDKVVLKRYSETFGKFLQYVNVGRDVGDDQRNLGKIWWPAMFYEPMSSAEFVSGTSDKAGGARSKGLEEIIEKAVEHGEGALQYLLSIPKDVVGGYWTFCVANYVMGMETLKRMTGNEAVFSEDGGVKLTRGAVGNILHHVALSGNCTEEWLKAYSGDSDRWIKKSYINLSGADSSGSAEFVSFTSDKENYRAIMGQAEEFAVRGDEESARHAREDAQKIKKSMYHVLRGDDIRLRDNPEMTSFEEGRYVIGEGAEKEAIQALMYEANFAPIAALCKERAV